jgi:Fe-S-cluster-containing dehydrogenase component
VKAFTIDVTICNGCFNCQVVCKDEHCGNDWTPYAKPQPQTGQFWGKLNEYVRGTVGAGLSENPVIRMSSKVKMSYVFLPCQHCENAPCITACQVEGALYERSDGLVIIDPRKCTGCMNCIDACPYGCIYFNEALNLTQKCTGCAHLLDRGWPIAEPRCADACPTEAIKFGEETELDLSGTETLHPEYGLTTRVHYKGLPKRFIAGTVYDPGAKEVIIDATCTLSGAGTGTATTNGFGDFWFEGLDVGTFSLTVSAAGKNKTIDNISTEQDVNLGDIALS